MEKKMLISNQYPCTSCIMMEGKKLYYQLVFKSYILFSKLKGFPQ